MRRVGTIVVAVFGVVLGVLVPKLAAASTWPAVCHAENGSSKYEFNGDVTLANTPGQGPHVHEYTAQFDGIDSSDPENIPVNAKNDFTVEIIRFSDDARLYQAESPDNLAYAVPYAEFPSGWGIQYDTNYFGKFVANFDKRDTPDASCRADTPSFFWPRPPKPGPLADVCEQVDCNILD
jgi:hypothetical protein